MTGQFDRRWRREHDRRPLLIAAVFVLLLTSGLGAWPHALVALCPSILIASSNEKAALMSQLAADYSSTHGSSWSGCGPVVTVENVASGDAEHQLEAGWPGAGRPDVWTPAATTWVLLLQSARTDLIPRGEGFQFIASSPLVVAVPDPMAKAMNWPAYDPTWSELLQLAEDPRGWARFGHPEWGSFRLGMTDPRTSTSGIHSLIAAYDAATGKSEPTTEDIKTPTARAFVAGVEKSVSHYASTAGIFLDNMARADSLTFASAVAVEEQEVFNYNEGLHSPVTPKEPPRIGLDAFYPAGGTLFADHPFVTLRAPWVNQAKSNIARNFLDWLQEPTQQSRFTDDGFRDYTHAAFGALASEPGILKAKPADLPLPNADTVAAIARSWSDLRDPARIELVIDLSDASQRVAAQKSVGELLDTDQVAVWDVEPSLSRMLLALTTLGGGRPKVLAAIDSAPLTRGPGPLYLTIKSAYESLVENADATHINAIIIITAHRDDGLAETLTDLEREIRAQTGQGSVRIYAVALQGSDTDALSGIASASGGVAAISTSPANAVRTSLGNF